NVPPARIPSLEPDAKPVLFRRDEAERRVVNLEIARQRRQINSPSSRCVLPTIGRDVLDVHGGRKAVDRRVSWIDNADAVVANEPYSSVSRLRHSRTIAAGLGPDFYAVRTVEDHRLNSARSTSILVDLGDPGFKIRVSNADQPARHIQPQRMHVVFHRPMHGIARQSVAAGERDHPAALQHAQATSCRGPQRAVWLELKAVDATGPEAAGGRIRRLNAALAEIDEAAVEESQPQAAVHAIRRKRRAEIH